MTKIQISEALKQFIERERSEYDFPLTVDLEVENDLGITGDDAVEFILAFGKEFDVDVSRFPLADYFDGEGANTNLIGFVVDLFRKDKKQKKTLTLGDLECAIKKKYF